MYQHFFKRTFDFLLALLALPFVLIVIAVAGIFIYREDRGPIFYNALRVGRNGKPFKMYKLRSMYVNAPDIRLADGSTYNGEDDPRVTKAGRFLRQTSIDELPQLLNVLKGDMSLIGPRPDPLDWLERYPEEYRGFLAVRPGITGYSQAYFRNSADGEEKMRNDLYYAENLSFVMDVKILLKTIQVVLHRENLYKEAEADAAQQAQELVKK